MGALETAQRKQLLADFVDFETKRGNGRIIVGADLEAGRIMGLGASMFEIYATKKVLGDYTEAELDRYVASKLKASDRAAKTPVAKR